MKPEFWKDPEVSNLAPVTRLTYIGLWMLADDGGWFRLDVPTISLELYGWDSRARREKAVTAALNELRDAERITVYPCGHAVIPTMTNHQRFAGETKRVYTVKREHEHCPRIPAGDTQLPAGDAIPAHPRGSSHTPATVRSGERVRNGSSRNVSSTAQKRDDESESEFRLRVGVPSFMGGES